MNVKELQEQLGMNSTYGNEIRKANYRLQRAVELLDRSLTSVHTLYTGSVQSYNSTILDTVEFQLGAQKHGRLAKLIDLSISDSSLKYNLLVVSLILEALDTECRLAQQQSISENYRSRYRSLEKLAKDALNFSMVGLGYTYQDGAFLKSEAKELEKPLVFETLEWLKDYSQAHKSFADALKHYTQGKDHYPDAITNFYSALESMTKTFLDTTARLDKPETINELVSKLGLEKNFGNILHYYCEIAHTLGSRHGKKEEDAPADGTLSPEVVEFYMYQTGGLIRLIISKMKATKTGD